MIIKSLAKKPGFNNWALVQSILTIKIFREIDGVLQKAKLQKRCDLFDLLIPPTDDLMRKKIRQDRNFLKERHITRGT